MFLQKQLLRIMKYKIISGVIYKSSLILFIFLFFFTYPGNTQSCINIIDTDHIFQKRKKKFIKNKYLININSFDELNPTCVDSNDSLSYSYQYETYYLKDDINKVWKSYKNISLPEIYSGHIVSLGFMYSKIKKKLFYLDSDNYEGMREGQVFFINLDQVLVYDKGTVFFQVIDKFIKAGF